MDSCHVFLLVVTLWIVARSQAVGGAKLVRKERSVSGSYLVVMKSSATDSEVDEFMKGLQSLSNSNETPYQASHMEGLYSISKGITVELNQDALELVQQSSLVDFIEEDGLVEGSALGWHLDRIDQMSSKLDNTFAPGGTGEGVDIYVLDSGINMNHIEFENRAFYAGIDVVDEYYGTNNEGKDCNGHGTHVASLAAGRTAGVAKKATLYSLRVLDCQKLGKQSSVLKALDYVTKIRIKNQNQSMVVVMSLIGPRSYLLNSAVDRAVREGIVVVTAAGNNRHDGCNYSPGSSSSSINVGATDSSNSLYRLGQYGTNYGRCIDIFAPGVKIRGANFRHRSSFTLLSGTSMACPLVAGAAAILLQQFPTSTPSRIKDALIHTSAKDRINFSTFRPPLQGSTQNRLLLINAETISNISDCSSEDDSKLVAEVTISDVNHPTSENVGKVQTTKEEPHMDEEPPTSVTASPAVKTTQPPSPTDQPTTPADTLHGPIRIHLKERCIQSMGEQMWNKNYTLQYMNYAGTKKNNTYFTTIYKYDPEAEDYNVQCSLSYERIREIFNTVSIKNQMIYLVVPYVVNNEEQYCVGLKRKQNGEPKPLHTVGLKPAQADQLYNAYKKFNYQLVGERYVVVEDEVKATSIYQYSPSAQEIIRYRDLKYNTLMNKIVEGQRKGYHIRDISSYVLKRVAHYSLLLTKNFSQLRYKWSLRSRQRTKGLLKMFTREGLYPLAIVSANLGYSQPYYLVSLTSAV